jgi:hypothetical protein
LVVQGSNCAFVALQSTFVAVVPASRTTWAGRLPVMWFAAT